MLALAVCISAADKPTETPTRKVDFDFGDVKLASGRVLAVTKTSILIDCQNTGGGKGPTSFPFHDRLAAGTVHKKVAEASSFRVCDVEVGDWVSLGTTTENKQVYCVDIFISERPGGFVPPSQVIKKERPWYQWQNAQIAFRDLGVPIPEHLKPKVPSIGKESNLPPEQHRGDYARAYGKKEKLPWLFRCPERKLDFDFAERRLLSGQVKAITEYGVTIAAPRQKPVCYWFHDRLYLKTLQKKATPAFSYLNTDVKVGDIVELGLIPVNYTVACADVSIRERPGGLVPAPQIVRETCPTTNNAMPRSPSETRRHRSPFISDRSFPRARPGPDSSLPKSCSPSGSWSSIRNSISRRARWSKQPVLCSL